jgi:hypothetical protein
MESFLFIRLRVHVLVNHFRYILFDLISILWPRMMNKRIVQKSPHPGVTLASAISGDLISFNLVFSIRHSSCAFLRTIRPICNFKRCKNNVCWKVMTDFSWKNAKVTSFYGTSSSNNFYNTCMQTDCGWHHIHLSMGVHRVSHHEDKTARWFSQHLT